MRKGVERRLRIRDPDLAEQLDRAPVRGPPVEAEVRRTCSVSCRPIESIGWSDVIRILEDHRQLAARDRPQPPARHADQLPPVEAGAAGDGGAVREQAEQREHRHRLPAAALAGDAEHLARLDAVVDPVDDGGQPGRRLQPDAQLLDGEQAHSRALPGPPRRSRVEDVAKAVADQVEGEHDAEDRQARERPDPPPLEVLRSLGDHRPPLGLRRLRAEPEEREPREEQDRVREVERGQHEDRARRRSGRRRERASSGSTRRAAVRTGRTRSRPPRGRARERRARTTARRRRRSRAPRSRARDRARRRRPSRG